MSRRLENNEALTRIGLELQRFGITRVAQQTDLDIIGVPCYAAVRPNSKTLAVNQGKGADDVSAQLSAIMEAVEFAVAEAPRARTTVRSVNEMLADDEEIFIREQSLPRGYAVDKSVRMSWARGQCLVTGRHVSVPLASAGLSAPDDDDVQPFSQSSNGLGAGYSASEATAHAFCELVERDASTLWSLRPLMQAIETAIDPEKIQDPTVLRSLASIRAAGFRVILFDLTSDLDLPVVMALLWSGQPETYFDVASGVCAHPSAERAMVGAIEEAAQTRISNISGARDDIDPDEYRLPLPSWIAQVVTTPEIGLRRAPTSMSHTDFASLPTRLKGRTVAIPLNCEEDAIWVVKVMSDDLEDRSTNVHWRPGPRAIRAMMQQ